MLEKIYAKLIQKRYQLLLLIICLVVFILYFPSLFTFYTHDDFFHLRIANVDTLQGFLNFFNLTKAPEGWSLYRPLTTQVFYFISIRFFKLNPLPLHVISFLTLFLIICLVFWLVRLLTKSNKIALLSAFLYATSATHFGHLYFLGAFQELGMALFFLLSLVFFIKFQIYKKCKYWWVSFLAFALAILSKETTVILPFVLVLVYFYLRVTKVKVFSLKSFAFLTLPYFVMLALYLFLRLNYYGFAVGDSYIWNFSPVKAFNTLGWYFLWSFNIPEMLVDFVSSGIKLSPTLFLYWGNQFRVIFILFALEIILILVSLVKNKKEIGKGRRIYFFGILWFTITLLPVLFLPLHKFTFYLTVPLLGIILILGQIFHNKKILLSIFCFVWFSVSLTTLLITRQTHWITRSAAISKSVLSYFKKTDLLPGKVIFYDTEKDKSLPWLPSQMLKVTLSDNNFFRVFYPDKYAVYYGNEYMSKNDGAMKLEARQFFDY